MPLTETVLCPLCQSQNRGKGERHHLHEVTETEYIGDGYSEHCSEKHIGYGCYGCGLFFHDLPDREMWPECYPEETP